MSSRNQILNSIKNINQKVVDLQSFEIQYDNSNLLEKFEKSLISVKSTVITADLNDLKHFYQIEKGKAQIIINCIPQIDNITENVENMSIEVLEKTDLCFLEAEFAVAENGAVWLSQTIIINRLLPFICKHLVLLIEKEKIVANMHAAYQLLNNKDYSFGLFLAGPSKTADIEQALVIGAHGSLTSTVFII